MKRLSRRELLHALRCFGLYVKGETCAAIAVQLHTEENVHYYQAGVRSEVLQAWYVVRTRCPHRWPRSCWDGFESRGDGKLTLGQLRGARYIPPPPKPDPDPRTPAMRRWDADLDAAQQRILDGIAALEDDARASHLTAIADGLRNMRLAVLYNVRLDVKRKKA